MLRTAIFGLFSVLAIGTAVEAASPRLNSIMPRGCQRGIESVLTFSGSQLGDAEEIFFYTPGFKVTKIEPVNANTFKATIAVGPEARIGEHVAQVRTKTGISDFRTFWVGYLPIAEEKEPNSDFAAPQPIPLNTTVTGIVQSEDVDYYVVEAKKGQRIAVEVEAMRLGTTLFDPYVAILDAKRFELASADDSPLVIQDAVCSAVAPEDGKYVIEVRESAYGGNGACNYRLHVGTFPRPTAVYPAGGKVGSEIDVKFLGDAAGEIVQKFKLPAASEPEFGLLAGTENNWSPSNNVFRLSDVDNALEVEPNDAVAQATPAAFPSAFNGILQAKGDVDFFKFTATKGQTFEVECYGRRIRSAIDPVMVLYNAQGGGIVSNDDSRGPDSYFRFTVPADGDYYLSVTDHLKRGGPEFVYRVEFQPVIASLSLSIPRQERYGQYRQQIYVAKNNRFGAIINAGRVNFGGELVLEPAGLPQGLKILADAMPANMSQMPVVFEATADAPLNGGLFDFRARHADPNQKIGGGFSNLADFIVAEPGQSLYVSKTVNRLPIAVVDELPFKVDVIPPKVPLAKDGSLSLKVVIERKPDFKAPIVVTFPFTPPGVGAPPSITIPEGQNEGIYTINAAGNAAVGQWKIFVMGQADIGGVAYSASQLIPLEISEHFMLFAINRTACEQGQETEIVAKVDLKKSFEGEAVVRVFGLPNKAVAQEVKFNKDAKEVVFKVKTEKDTPVGRHGTVFAQVTIPMNGDMVVHNVGGTELRVDAPLPPKVEAPKPAAPMPTAQATPTPAPIPQAPPMRRLTRLEQLRLDKAKAEGK